jgi:hypothetical protein
MTAAAIVSALPDRASPVSAIYGVGPSPRRGWIQSPAYDLALLSLVPLLGLAVWGLSGLVSAAVLSPAIFFILGMPHYLSTYTFFMDEENRAYCRGRRVAFFLGPVIVVAGLTLSLRWHFYLLVALVVDAWNLVHVSRQSAGILSVYRHLGGGDNRREKVPANLCLLSLAAALYFVHIDKQDSFTFFLRRLPFDIIPHLAPFFFLVGGAALAVLVNRMRSRRNSIPLSELAFLAGSLALFVPFILIDKRSTASSAMLSGHYVQYLGLVWLLNYRKYGKVSGAAPLLSRTSRSVPAVLAVLVTLVVVTSLADRAVHAANAMALHTWALNVVVLLHFYFDGLVWSFKQPHIRSAVAPYLLLPQHRLAA